MFDRQMDRQMLTARPCVCIRSHMVKSVNFLLGHSVGGGESFTICF